MKIARLKAVRPQQDRQSIWFVIGSMAIACFILFGFSCLQLWLFRAGNDLGFFDQLLYLLSQGQPPVSTLLEGVHLIGDHGAIIFYPLALLYIIYPSVYWLLAVQAIALSSAVVPLYVLSKDSGLSEGYARAVTLCYLLYPAVFNINFYTEFRPETIAVPALLWAVWAAQKRFAIQLAIAIAIVLSCKETMSLTVVGLGLWLAILERRKFYGLSCIVAGGIWFAFSALYFIPTFRGGHQMAGTWHYESLGSSLTEIALKVLVNPQIFLTRALAGDRLFYYFLLIAPLVWGLHWRKIWAFFPALPMLGLNILSDFPRQRDLIHQYSLPIIPFLLIWLIVSLVYLNKRRRRRWLSPRLLIIWSIVAWLALAKYGYFWTRYAPLYSNVGAVRGAIELVEPDARVLTSGYLAPHLSHRSTLMLLGGNGNGERAIDNHLDTVLIAKQHLGLATSQQEAEQTIKNLLDSGFDLVYQQQDVFLLKNSF